MAVFTLNKKVDYGLSLLSWLVKHPDSRVSLHQFSKLGLPRAFTAQIARKLVIAKILAVREGQGGGYILAASPAKISLRQVLEALDGPISLVNCDPCPAKQHCRQKNFMWGLTSMLHKTLAKKTLADLCL